MLKTDEKINIIFYITVIIIYTTKAKRVMYVTWRTKLLLLALASSARYPQSSYNID